MDFEIRLRRVLPRVRNQRIIGHGTFRVGIFLDVKIGEGMARERRQDRAARKLLSSGSYL
jgi:hypothetical protein